MRVTRTRRAFVATIGAAIVGVASWRALFDTKAHATTSKLIDFSGRARQGGTWGSDWIFTHYRRERGVEAGLAYVRVPGGLDTTAPDQPIAVFLRDNDCSECDLRLTFQCDNPTLRPGLLFQSDGAYDYTGVTVEQDHLVCSTYARAARQHLASVPIQRLRAGTRYELRVAVEGTTAQATLTNIGTSSSQSLQVDLHAPPRVGSTGILLLHPTDLRPATLQVEQYEVTAARFASTAPHVTYLVCGPSTVDAPGRVASLRVGTVIPSDVQFEWSSDPNFVAARRSPWVPATDPPFTATSRAELPLTNTVYWRARLRSRSSDATLVSSSQSISLPVPVEPLTLLAGSCVQFYDERPTHGYRRLLAASETRPALMFYQGDLGYANNRYHSCYAAEEDYFADRFVRFLADPLFAELRSSVPTGFTLDDHDYGPRNNADRTTAAPWVAPLWARLGADPSETGYFDVRFADVHCFTLDGRRYADPITTPNSESKTKLGIQQRDWLEAELNSSTANIFLIFSADIFASRYTVPHSPNIPDCFVSGWPDEYRRLMTLFYRLQDSGRRVLILSGDAHSLRIHYHPRPDGRRTRAAVVEFICSGLRPRRWSGAATGDPTLDPLRNVLGHAGAGLVTLAPPQAAPRTVSLRAISGEQDGPADLFPPLILPFHPSLPASRSRPS